MGLAARSKWVADEHLSSALAPRRDCILAHARFSRCSQSTHAWSASTETNSVSAGTHWVPAGTNLLHAVSGHARAQVQWNQLAIKLEWIYEIVTAGKLALPFLSRKRSLWGKMVLLIHGGRKFVANMSMRWGTCDYSSFCVVSCMPWVPFEVPVDGQHMRQTMHYRQNLEIVI